MLNPAQIYKQQKDNREALVDKYAPLVKRIALHLKARLPASVQLDDLIQSGMIGLLEAAQNYEGGLGATFDTFASIRIRGAMIDELRRSDWAPRHVHKNDRAIAEVHNKLSHKLGRLPTEKEIADEMDVSLEEYHQMIMECSSCQMIGIEDLGVTEDVISGSPDEKADIVDPSYVTSRKRFMTALVEAIKQLPEREALVISLYYDEEMNLKEIGAVLSISESRVSQILSQTVMRLGAMLKDWKE